MTNKEVRDILLGRIVRKDEQLWAAAPADAKFRFHGLRDGAGDVRLFGVSRLTRGYQATEMEQAEVFAEAEAVLRAMGRPMILESKPMAKSCLYAPNWIAPVLLCVEEGEDELRMTAYTSRSPLVSHFRCRIALWIFERRLPEGVTYSIKAPERKTPKKKAKETGKKGDSQKKKKGEKNSQEN